jgi:hypothetical protein
LPVVLYGCETLLLTLRKKIRLVLLRRKFGPKQDSIAGEWRKLHNGELNDLHSSQDIIWMMKLKRMRLLGHVACMG